jgi:hypothetical protein
MRDELRDYTNTLDAIPPLTWAYLAGVFAGEGYLAVSMGKDVPVFGLGVEMCDRDTVELFRVWLGGVFVERPARTSKPRVSWQWRLTDGYRVREVVRRMLPYLTGVKRAHAHDYLAFVDYKLAAYEHRKARGLVGYDRKTRHQMLQLALKARRHAGGGLKAWRGTWESRLAELAA